MNDNVIAAMAAKGREIISRATNGTPTFRERAGIAPATAPAEPAPPPATSEHAAAMAATLRNDPRPYARPGMAEILPPVGIVLELYARNGNPELLGQEREPLRKAQRRIAKLERENHKLGVDGILERRQQAKANVRAGRGSEADLAAINSRQSLIDTRKALKKQIMREIEKCQPQLAAVAARVEALARRTLPSVEGEAAKLGISPAQVPLVTGIGDLCWMPTRAAKFNTNAPKRFLRELGINL